MEQYNETDILNTRIALLEIRQAEELKILKEQFQLTYESIKPINLIKHAFSEMTNSAEIKGNILSNVIGLSTGYLSRKVLLGSTHNPIKRILGSILQYAVANIVTKSSDTFISKE